MKVAFCVRRDYSTDMGGDSIQVLKTKTFLEKRYEDIDISIIIDPREINSSFDICHIFNYATPIETEAYFMFAKNSGCLIVSSPIFWDYRVTAYNYFCQIGIFGLTNSLMKFEQTVLKIVNKLYPSFFLNSKRFAKYCKSFVDESVVILPNSVEEAAHLNLFISKYFDVDISHKVQTVFNATNLDSIEFLNKDAFYEKYKIPENFVLQVSRIQPVKNQMNVVKALMNDKHIPIVFVGRISNEKYYNKLKSLADSRGNVYFIQEVPHQEVFSFYKHAALHILPSLRESPGLVSLEAYKVGCNILCSKFPYSPFKTYFDKIGNAIDPLDTANIRDVIKKLYENPIPHARSEEIDKFTWDNAARQTYDAYQIAMQKKI